LGKVPACRSFGHFVLWEFAERIEIEFELKNADNVADSPLDSQFNFTSKTLCPICSCFPYIL